MGFLSVLKKISHGLEIGLNVAAPFVPLASALIPGGALINTIFNSVVMAETLITPPGSGAQKKQIVTDLVNQAHPNIPPAVLSKSIDGVVVLLNDLSTAVANVPAAAPIKPPVMKITAIKR